MKGAWGRVWAGVLTVGLFLVEFTLGGLSFAGPPVKEDPHAGVTQNWDKNLPSDSRFTVLPSFNNEAVRDNNTGLVWERTQDLNPHTWVNATWYCANKIVGGTIGWRLPSVVELKSVQDVSTPFPANINSVFNFTGGGADNWWSATTSGVASTDAWIVDVNGGRVNGNSKANGQGLAWCVRGPMNADTY